MQPAAAQGLLERAGDEGAVVEQHQKRRGDQAARALTDLAYVYSAEGNWAAAERSLREGLVAWRVVLDDDPATMAFYTNNVGGFLDQRGDEAGAERLYREASGLELKGKPAERTPLPDGLVTEWKVSSAFAEESVRDAVRLPDVGDLTWRALPPRSYRARMNW